MMRAVTITRPAGALELREIEKPTPPDDHVLVRVRATAVNRADLLQVAGRYPVPPDAPADIPGLEFAGEIVALGGSVSGWRPGDRVFGIVAGGAYAQYCTVHHGSLAAIPPDMDWNTAAAIPEAFITAHDALITQARLQPGESVLIHAVGSGVGLAAVQVACWRGARAYGTSRTASKLEAARGHGLVDGVVVAGDVSAIVGAARAWVHGAGMDVVLDLVGGAYVAPGVEVLGLKGRMVLVGTVAGNRAEVRLDQILRKRLTLQGTVLRARSSEEKGAATAAFVKDLFPAFAAGELRATVHAVLPLERAAEAHRIVAEDRNTGKVVLTVS